jgi:hypothetical protein
MPPPGLSMWFVRLTTVVLLLTLCGMGTFFYLAFVQRLSPLERQRFVSMEATNAGGHGTVLITREFCAREDSDGNIIRIFRRVPQRPEELEEVYELPPLPIHLLAGCHVRPRVVDVPDSIVPGRYLYTSGLRFCSPVRCVTDWFPPVTVDLDTFEGRHQLRLGKLD